MDEITLDRSRLINLPTVHRAYRWEKEGDAARCGACHQNCLIPEGEKGFCRVKMNLGGMLHTLVYGDVISCESRPVEMKPFFHFYPGKSLLTICGPSCNMRCPWCQNHQLSRAEPRPLKAKQVETMDVVNAALAAGDVGLCVSFTEPMVLFEYCMGLFREASARKLACTFVSNGYMTSDAMHMLSRAGMNAINVDIKGSDEVYREYCGARQGDKPAWDTVRNALEMGMHVEVVHLVVTGLNDRRESFEDICRRHLEYAGTDVPLHITAYRPAFEYREPPTSLEFLEWAYGAAREAGILFPYLGNVPGHRFESTYCPECDELLLKRSGFTLERDLTDGYRCPSCGYALPVVG